MEKDNTMQVNRVSLARAGYYGQANYRKSDHFNCTVEVVGDTGKIELAIPPEISVQIMAVIAEQIAEAGRAVADMMVADSFIIQQPDAPKEIA